MKTSQKKFFETGLGLAVFYVGAMAVCGGIGLLTMTVAPPLSALAFMGMCGAGLQGCVLAAMPLLGMEFRSESHEEILPPGVFSVTPVRELAPKAAPGFNQAVSAPGPSTPGPAAPQQPTSASRPLPPKAQP